ncbi:YggS family pyridoxal phosphate-dependent enzyme [Trueperella bialowiezensis]|uniref:Pyridoxal phosphate homeostasis protein n=1 Tax=Trueperella bialowiezensis TaxID=312285 RepID=A0A3S4VF35_9ACTO|nr:YggS family pyridoxal phosphate-dependent enzyme [Trueperella bialowiezensis]VEI12752.1 Predicted enzyme with a TIM-barrel fold [Trueperella bialowiezensis]
MTISIAQNIARLTERIERAEGNAGRQRGSVKLMLAAKHQPVENLLAASAEGVTLFGHNIVQQLEQSVQGLQEAAISSINTVIGPVQSNKLRAAMTWADRIDTVDSLKTAQRIARRQQARIDDGEASGPYPILIQVNSSGSTTQSGCSPDELVDLAGQISELDLVRIDGLMTIGAHTSDTAKIHRSFALTRELSLQMRGLPGLEDAAELSMGMTGDLDIAIAEGATTVRVGTAVFGERPRS